MDVETRLRELRAASDLHGAATLAIEAYGPEVLGFLVVLLRDEDDARDAFSQACEDLWVGLARFEGRSSMRTWIYTLARHAASRLRRSPHRRPGRNVALSQVSDAVERVRTATAAYQRTEAKQGLAQIRDALDPDDRSLLVLRVDRNMGWNDIAAIMAGEELDGSDAALARTAARLRKRYQLLKEELRARARAAGIVPDRDR